MSDDIVKGSVDYLLSRNAQAQWTDLLRVLADELNTQMAPEELRLFFRALGRRLASINPLPSGQNLAELESGLNHQLKSAGWGWVSVRDGRDHLEIEHSCSPLRQAFGDAAMSWAGGILEGLHADWMRQAGADPVLELHQTGEPEGPFDTFRFRLAHSSLAA